MSQESPSLTLRGSLSAGGTHSDPATLTIMSDHLVLSAPVIRYKLKASQISAIEPISVKAVAIRHTIIQFPEDLRFYLSESNSSESLEQIDRLGFSPAASMEAIPNRNGFPLRIEILLFMLLVVHILGVVDRQIGWSTLQPGQMGRYSPLSTSLGFIFALLMALPDLVC